ncbi:MAG TPA: L,D-transpeptidase [Thermomicrobiales bacterium]|nr:L,D-transpeptidase [Thermomicrobiales bacterium]
MRVIGAGLAVFLAVTAILLYQVTSGGNETAAIAVVVSPEATAIATVSPSSTVSPIAQLTTAIPTATKTAAPPPAPATTAPVEPTVEVADPVIESAEPELAETDTAVDDEVNEPESVNEDAEPDATDDGISEPSLASVDSSDWWSDAIETPNGGTIGMVLSGIANVRALPAVDAEIIDILHTGWPVAIYGVVAGDLVSDSAAWYQVSSGGYVSSELIGPYVPAEPEVYHAGHWIDVDLTNNIAVAYVDDVPVNAVTVITGKAGFATPIGDHTIFARVELETLDSATVGTPQGDPEYYYLPNVPHTQYFATGGFAIHANYWSDPWQYGSSTSHGCVNMFPEDAAWFWWFLDIGSVVSVHY